MNEHDMIEKEILETVGATSGCIEPDEHLEERIEGDPIEDDGMTDVEADADALAGAGWGTDEDYGYFGGGDE